MTRTAAAHPAIGIHYLDEHTVILRQSKSVHYEAPFCYLLFGDSRALLLDTGATADPSRFPLRDSVDQLVGQWLTARPRTDYGLVVAHTHGHGDHVAGDGQFDGRPRTVVVGRDLEAVQQFFGFTDWPGQVVELDLGGRVLEITGSPGHQRAAITTYDPWTGNLLTGDTVLPGRLYVADRHQYQASLDRMAEFAASRRVSGVLGCHIEMTRLPGRDFPLGARYQPDEHELALSVAQLLAVRDAFASVADRRGVHVFDDFIVYNEPRPRDMLRLIVRGAAARALGVISSRGR